MSVFPFARVRGEIEMATDTLARGGNLEASEIRQLKKNLGNMQKALVDAGYQTPAVTTGADNGPYSPIYPESLDDMFTVETWKLEDQVLFLQHLKDRAWKEATQTVEQIVVLKDRGGTNQMPIAFAEGGVPGGSKVNMDRRSIRMKYMGRSVHVTDQAAFIRGIAGKTALDHESQYNMEQLIRDTDHALWHADASIVDEEYNGFISTMEQSDVADLVVQDYRGATVGLADLQDLIYQATRRAGGYSKITDIYVPPALLMQMDRDEISKVRHMAQNGQYPGSINYGNDGGFSINLTGPMGGSRIPLHATYAFEPSAEGNSLVSTQPLGAVGFVPSTPVLAGNPTIGADANSLFDAAEAGSYSYAICGVGPAGVSAPLFVEVAADTQLAIADGESAEFEIVNPADGITTHYRIYRTAKDVDGNSKNPALVTWHLIARVQAAGVGNTTYIDLNERIAGASDIVLMNFKPEFVQYRELLPTMRRHLYTLDTTQRFMMMHWGNLHVRSPIKHRVLRNIRPASVGA